MLFSLKEFEHFFSASNLKKGLHLFEQNQASLIPAKKGEGRTFAVGDQQLTIQRRADKILSYSCTCGKATFCEHLAALAFFLQRDIFPNRNAQKLSRSAKTEGPLSLYRKVLTTTKNKILVDYFGLHTPSEKVLRKAFQTVDAAELELCCLFWKQRFTEMAPNDPVNATHIKQCITLLDENKALLFGKSRAAYILSFRLSCLMELRYLLQKRYNTTEESLRLFADALQQVLEKQFTQVLKPHERACWSQALLVQLRGSVTFHPQITLFILARALQLSRSRSYFSELTTLLEEKHYRQNYQEPFNALRIAKWMLYIQQKKIFHTAFPSGFHSDEPEYHLALAELHTAAGKPKKALDVLRRCYESWSPSQRAHRMHFRDVLLHALQQQDDHALELHYLLEALRYDLHIHPSKLARVMALMNSDSTGAPLNNLLQRLRMERSALAQDKINTILFETGRWEDLIVELRKQENNFLLLHKVLMAKWPDYSNSDLELYLQQLMQAFSNRRVFHRPEDLFAFAMTYIRKLSTHDQDVLKEAILAKLGGRSLIHQLVSDLFDGKN